jgi:hypothetical protein
MRPSLRVVDAAGLLSVAACGSESPRASDEAASPPAMQPDSASITTAGSCVDQYTLESLSNRDYAFDGVVAEITQGAGETAEDVVVFDVSRWYKGGSGSRATRRAYGFAAVTSAGGEPHAVGERLLVAGDDDYVWECGFTQPYDADVAADWDERLS